MAFIWHLSVIHFTNHHLVSGVLMRGQHKVDKRIASGLKNAVQVARTYFTRAYADQLIHVHLGDRSDETRTGPCGNFSLLFDTESEGKVRIFTEGGREIIGNQVYPVYFSKNNYDRLIISDIDDTIMRSYTRSKFKRLFVTLFTPYGKREVIKATYRLYASLQGERASFFYVSKSEANLFPLISKFIGYNELPPGPLFLTPYLNFSNFLRGKKDPAFKYLTICHILDHSEKKPAVLIGDDTQADLAIFARISEKYTDQIEKVYIRKTRRKMTSEQQLLWNNLIKTGVEQVYYGHDYLTVSKKNNR